MRGHVIGDGGARIADDIIARRLEFPMGFLIQQRTDAMATERDIPQRAAMSRSDGPLSKLYREFGMLALAAALGQPRIVK